MLALSSTILISKLSVDLLIQINEIEIANKINKICTYLIPKVKNKLNTTKILAHAKRELRMNGIDKIDYLTILTDNLEKRKSQSTLLYDVKN